MNIVRLLFELFVLYLLYKLIFEFIIPIYRTTKQVKRKMSEMHQQMEEKQAQYKDSYQKPAEPYQPTKGYQDDYIEYEEVK
ncbi:MAG TPA: hypothetical protein PLC48_11260 [Ferruginibacter sp.]|nr:hypothetical protein [Ferruginibacter sp.]